MSEKQNSGAPTETQPSGGFDGERRDSEASEQSLSRRVSRETSTPPQRNKPSSFYVYLAILFGAAFLMLLLAYFVQQRSNETVRDNLRTATASRQELLEEIQRLEEENAALQKEKEDLGAQLKKEQAHSTELQETLTQTMADGWKQSALDGQSEILYLLEKLDDMGDYLMMGDIVKRFDMFFNRLNPDFSNEYLTSTQEARYLQLREELFEKSDFMIMEQRQDGSELPKFDDTVPYGVSYAAVNLETIIRFYLTSPTYAADTIATYFQPDSDGAEALYGGAFKRSTLEWLEEIKAELINQGYLGEHEDGTMELLIPYS